jgi:hypothetical protein
VSHLPRHAARALLGASIVAAAGVVAATPLAPDSADARWFLDRLDPQSAAARSMLAAPDAEAALAALDRHLLAGRVEAVPLDFISHGRALDHYRADRTARIRRYPPRSLVPPIDWRSGPDQTFLAELHSWRYLTPLLEEYRRHGDAELLAAAEAVVRDWWRDNGSRAGAPARAWHEGSVVKRTIVLVNWLQVLAERPVAATTLPPHEVAWLLDRHVQILLAPGQYRGPGNHEIRQDLALVLASLALRHLSAAAGWRELALQRLVDVQIARGFSREGVWLEHSPAYHGYVLFLLLRLHEVLAMNGVAVPEPLVELFAASDRYLAAIVTPAGLYPPLGDSAEQLPPAALVDRSPSAAFPAGRGARGSPAATLDAFFPDAGQAVLTDRAPSAAEPERRLYVLLQAAQHLPMGHRHEDALSFIVHFDGRWWLREAGRYGYRSGEERDFVLSQPAHNTHRLAGRSPLPSQHPELAVDTQTVSAPGLAAARAFSQRFPVAGARAERVVALLRREKILLVADRLNAPIGGWESYFNLAPDLEVIDSANDLLMIAPSSQRSGDWVLDVHLDPGDEDGVAVIKGATRPLLGWASLRDLELLPAPVIVLRRPAKRFDRYTLFHWRRRNERPLSDLQAEALENGIRVEWRQAGELMRLEAHFSGVPAAR